MFYILTSGFQLSVEKFVIFLLINNLVTISACSVAFWVSAAVPNFAVANVLVSLPYIIMMLFGGFLANIETILPWLAWLKWFSIFRYGINVSYCVFFYDTNLAQPRHYRL